MSLDKDDWGSSFGCDPDWHHKKIASLEESLVLAKQQRDVALSNAAYYKQKSEDFHAHILMIESRLVEKACRISKLEGNP